MNENNYQHQPQQSLPPQPPNGYRPPESPPGEGQAIASLVFGIIAMVIFIFNWCIPFAEVAVGIPGIIFALSAKKKGYTGGKQSAGMTLSTIATSGGAIFWGACSMCTISDFLFRL